MVRVLSVSLSVFDHSVRLAFKGLRFYIAIQTFHFPETAQVLSNPTPNLAQSVNV